VAPEAFSQRALFAPQFKADWIITLPFFSLPKSIAKAPAEPVAPP